MAKLEDMEIGLSIAETYDDYKSNVDRFAKQSRQDHFDQVRYAMNIAHNAAANDAQDKVMFVGGIGVLGNLVKYCGTRIISQWRGTRDLDLMLYSPQYKHVISSSFDVVDYEGKSNSIKDKLCFRGYSNDAEFVRLGAAAVDAYTPSKSDPREGMKIGQAKIAEDWKEERYANFFGIPVKVLNPMTLLRTKLSVENSKGLPRSQDLDDIVNLLGLLECEGKEPADIFDSLGGKRTDYLMKSLSAVYDTNQFDEIFTRAVVTNTNKFRKSLGELI